MVAGLRRRLTRRADRFVTVTVKLSSRTFATSIRDDVDTTTGVSASGIGSEAEPSVGWGGGRWGSVKGSERISFSPARSGKAAATRGGLHGLPWSGVNP